MFALFNDGGLVKWKYYDDSDSSQYYYFEQDDNGNWFVKNFADETFINKGAGSYSTTISTSAEATTAQVFEPAGVPGKFTFKFDGNPYVYSLTASHNGSKEGVNGTLNIWGTAAEAQKFGMNVWFLRPVSDDQIEAAKEAMAAGLEDLIAEYEAANLQGSDIPGYYVPANIDALNDLIAEAKELGNASADERLEAISNLKAAYNKAISEYSPVTEGYYTLFIDNAKIAENQKSDKAMYINTETDDKALYWGEYDENDVKFIFKLTPAENGAWNMQSVGSNLYTGGASEFCGNFASTEEPTYPATFTFYAGTGSAYIKANNWTMCPKGNAAGTADGPKEVWADNGEGTSGGNVPHAEWTWRLTQIDEEKVNELLNPTITDYWQIADEPSMDFEPGKTYVLKNAYNDKYLSTDGGTVGQVNEIENFEIFSVEAAGEGTYYLQSLTAEEGQNYFQYNDYASQTWDGGVPYDGYDWYDYAGFNGEFGAAETAQEFTILRAVEAGEEDANNTPGSGKAVKEGSYIFTAKDQVMGKWYKLGVQGTNAALEPYNEDVAWYFYEATPVEDASGALEKAIAQYGDKQMQGGDAPGFYAADAVAEYNEAVQEAKDAVDSGDDAAKRAAVAALKEAGKKEYATNPIVDGETYFIVSAGYGPGYYTSATPPTEDQWYDDREAYAMYNADGAVKWGQYDDTMTRYAYTFTQDADGNWEVKNVADNSYIGRCVNNEGADAEYSGKVSTTEGVTYKQQFQFISEGKFFMTFVGERGLVTAYALTNSHNGSKNGEAEPGNIGNWGTASEAAKFGVNVWYLIPVSDEMKEKLTAVDGIAAGGEGFGVQSAEGGISFTADKAQTLRVVSASGAVVALQKVEAGETVSIQLVPGIYIVNGKKIAVK